MRKNNILIVDDEEDIRRLIRGILEDEGFDVSEAATAASAYETIETKTPDLIVLDIWLQGSEHDGLEILGNVKAKYPFVPIIMISGHGTIETAVSALQKGAYDFIEKPFKSDRLILMIRRALETAALQRENQGLRQDIKEPENLIGNSQATQDLKQILDRVAGANSRVLISGEAGAGKDIAARYIHSRSERKEAVFKVLNCAALSPERLDTQLFGEQTQNESSAGVLEQADGGTLFLDQITDMPMETQGKILRVLQDQRFRRVGGTQEIEVDVRIIAAANKDLDEEVKAGRFREDLYYRLNVVPVQIPPLRNRLDDLKALVEYFVLSHAGQDAGDKKAKHQFSAEAIERLKHQSWPGNVRQLRNVVEWVMIMNAHHKSVFRAEDLPPQISGQVSQAVSGAPASNVQSSDDAYAHLSLREAREEFEKQYLSLQVERFDGNISNTAKFIGMERSALHRKLKTLGLLSDKDKQLKTA